MNQIGKENALFYTKPTDDPETSPSRAYTLRGVATTPSTFYTLEKTRPEAEDDLINLDTDEWQWWKLEYVSSDAKPVVTKKVVEEDVLQAARTESRNVLLVYADKFAVDYEPTPLPSQLTNFVRTDNLSFQAELNDSLRGTRESPGKRKALSDDQDDLTTEHPRSPPHFNRDHLSEDSLDPNPPGYYDDENDLPPSPSPTRSFRPLRPKIGVIGTTDDPIPISFRKSDLLTKSTDMSVGHDDPNQSGQEMQERGSKHNLLQNRTDVKEAYKLGDYSPEINMEDDEEDDAALLDGKGDVAAKPNSRSIRGDTW